MNVGWCDTGSIYNFTMAKLCSFITLTSDYHDRLYHDGTNTILNMYGQRAGRDDKYVDQALELHVFVRHRTLGPFKYLGRALEVEKIKERRDPVRQTTLDIDGLAQWKITLGCNMDDAPVMAASSTGPDICGPSVRCRAKM